MADFDRRIENASDTLSRKPETPTTEELVSDPLIDRMVRIPTEEDFEEVLKPEGNSGDIMGSDVSGSTAVSNASVAGT